MGDKKQKGPDIPALRPWDWPDRQPYSLGVMLGGKIGATGESSVGWAAMTLDRESIETGETVFREGQTRAQKIAETVTQYELLIKQHGEAGTVRLHRYTAKSWPRSRAFQEGMTMTEHRDLVKDTAAALREAGATVEIWTV